MTTDMMNTIEGLRGELEQATAREVVLAQALKVVWKARESAEYIDFVETGVIGWVLYLDKYESNTIRDALQDRSAAAAALLERLAELEFDDFELETQIPDLKTDLALNATMLAHQCDLAREAETKAAVLRGELERAEAEIEHLIGQSPATILRSLQRK